MRVPSQRSHERLQYNRREERTGLRCTSSRPARFHRSAPRMRPRIRATRASSPTSEMPRIGGRYFNREKSGDVAPRHPGFVPVRTGHVSEPATSFFSRNSSDRPPASGSRGALQSLNVRNRRTRILLTRGVIALLRPPARQSLLARFRIHLRSFMPAVQCPHFAPVQSQVVWPFPLHIARSSSR